MGKSDVGDDNYFSTVLKINFYTGIVSILGQRAKPLRFFTVCNPNFFHDKSELEVVGF